MTFLDVGANVGVFSLLFGKRVGESEKVVSFEPNPEVLDRIRSNISRNCFENRVMIKNKPLSATSVTLSFDLTGVSL